MRILKFIPWFLWIVAAAYLIFLRWSWLIDYRQTIIAVVVVLGLVAAVFPLSSRLASKDTVKSDSDRLKLQNDIRATFFQAIAGIAVLSAYP
jgi:hypothetical protein